MSKKKAAAEKARLEAALKAATDDARRMYTTHEKERRELETLDRAATDQEQFERLRERKRLEAEEGDYKSLAADLKVRADLARAEEKKHAAWRRVTECDWLPSVDDEAQITAFLGHWAEDQATTLGNMDTEKVVHMKVSGIAERMPHVDQLIIQRLDSMPTEDFRRKRVDADLDMCVRAVQLAENIWRARDEAVTAGDAEGAAKHKRHLRMVYDGIQGALDRMTCLVGLNLDIFGDPEDDYLLRVAPSASAASRVTTTPAPSSGGAGASATAATEPLSPLIKFGLWLRTNDKRMGVGSNVMFQSIGVFVEPKDPSSVRLPRALGITQNQNTTLRAIQLSFDPCAASLNETKGQRFIALDCVLELESISLPEKYKKFGDWTCRTEQTRPPTLQRLEYPPAGRKGDKSEQYQQDELVMKVSFELPKTVVYRKVLQIGKWVPQLGQWVNTAIAKELQESIRRFAFLTTDLTTLAVIQEKGHEVPYESWSITPISDDEVMFHLLGRIHDDGIDIGHGGDPLAREVQILIREGMCRLVAPEDPELAPLRAAWMPPATLLRRLARAGLNFLLSDADGDTMPHVLTKTKALEERGYRDIALFASRFAIASSRHNKAGEDRDMALFRVSKERRAVDDDAAGDLDAAAPAFEPSPADESKWHSVRYETSRCVLAQFREADDDAVLAALDGHETHLNLYKCLAAAHGERPMEQVALSSNPLLQQGIYSVLSLVRPFSWG